MTVKVIRLYRYTFLTPRYIRAGQESISTVQTIWSNSPQR